MNLLNGSDNESSKFETKKWYIFHDKNGTDYGECNNNDTSVKFETRDIKSSFGDYYSDA